MLAVQFVAHHCIANECTVTVSPSSFGPTLFVSYSDCMNGWVIVNNELERMWKKAFVA
jgi:hypothetical protein